MLFAPLHIISAYTFLSSGLTIERIGRSIHTNDYFGAGIADKNVMYGVPYFIKMMETIKKPFIVGLSLVIDDEEITLYAINEDGYRSLCYISTYINQNEINLDFFKDKKDGIIAILDTNKGKFKQLFEPLEKIDNSFTFRYNKFAKAFQEFYLGVEVTTRQEVKYANKVRNFAHNYSYETIAFPTIHYEKKDDAIILSIVNAIKNDEQIEIKKEEGQNYFMKEEDYQKIYTPQEIKLTTEIISKSSFNYHQKRGELLHYPVEDSVLYLREQVAKGLAKKGLAQNLDYLKRANHEIEVIINMGYADYFLIVQDYVMYAKNNGIIVGSGRGSAAGSLVSYALGITEVDPLKYDLQFERFLNEGRKTMPDIDIDFMDSRHDEMIEYMRHKYGASRVANIITFQTIGAKQSIRDIARIYNYYDWLANNLSKAIGNFKGTLRECYKTIPDFKKLVDSDQYYLEIVSLASKIEGMPRQSGLHAAGIVLNNNPIEEAMPVCFDLNDNYITQYGMHFLEEQGFLKMDFLSLRNLTIVANTLSLIEKYEHVHLPFDKIPYDSKETYDLIREGKVMGIFQLESPGMKRAAKILEPTCFDDVVALISLFRPGPMDSIPSYGKRKKGLEKPTYISEDIKKVLGPTYGILVYQEQINSIAQVMAGFSLSEADLFRRGVAKKDAKVLNSLKEKFITGSIKKGYQRRDAEMMFNAIYKFANYGFNKSHAVGYAILACQMAYLKAKFPLEFYASILTINATANDVKFGDIVSEMHSSSLKIALPDINKSDLEFIIDNNALIFPLSEIRGLPRMMATNIVEERNYRGAFTDFFNFISRMYIYKISDKQIEALINAGVFDTLNPSRDSLRASITRGVQYAELNYNDDGQVALTANLIQAPSLVKKEDNPLENIRLEYETIGIMLSSNPLTYHRDALIKKGTINISEVKSSKGEVIFGGMVKAKKIINTKKNTKMAYVTIMDEYDEIEITLFSEVLAEASKYLEFGTIVLVKGNNRTYRNETSFIANEVSLFLEE